MQPEPKIYLYLATPCTPHHDITSHPQPNPSQSHRVRTFVCAILLLVISLLLVFIFCIAIYPVRSQDRRSRYLNLFTEVAERTQQLGIQFPHLQLLALSQFSSASLKKNLKRCNYMHTTHPYIQTSQNITPPPPQCPFLHPCQPPPPPLPLPLHVANQPEP